MESASCEIQKVRKCLSLTSECFYHYIFLHMCGVTEEEQREFCPELNSNSKAEVSVRIISVLSGPKLVTTF